MFAVKVPPKLQVSFFVYGLSVVAKKCVYVLSTTSLQVPSGVTRRNLWRPPTHQLVVSRAFVANVSFLITFFGEILCSNN